MVMMHIDNVLLSVTCGPNDHHLHPVYVLHACEALLAMILNHLERSREIAGDACTVSSSTASVHPSSTIERERSSSQKEAGPAGRGNRG